MFNNQEQFDLDTKEALCEILSDAEIGALEALNDNSILKGAIQKVLLAQVYNDGVLRKSMKKVDPMMNPILGFVAQNLKEKDEVIGNNLKAQWYGICAVDIGFKKLELFQRQNTRSKEKEDNNV